MARGDVPEDVWRALLDVEDLGGVSRLSELPGWDMLTAGQGRFLGARLDVLTDEAAARESGVSMKTVRSWVHEGRQAPAGGVARRAHVFVEMYELVRRQAQEVGPESIRRARDSAVRMLMELQEQSEGDKEDVGKARMLRDNIRMWDAMLQEGERMLDDLKRPPSRMGRRRAHNPQAVVPLQREDGPAGTG